MQYILAKEENISDIYDLVQESIKIIYPKYYPKEVVDFFSNHHSLEAVARDVIEGNVSILTIDNNIVGTGSFIDNHITRIYVLPEYQRNGYGRFIMKTIEAEIVKKYNVAYLDASLPAAVLYEKLGYKTIKHEQYPVENGVVLAYEIMEKELY
ncbi:MAG: GCN5-related N-acetyltransferase [Clostridiales bacterium]|jgi:GNAT superfamily N-acetyltransferase|nr:GCN5-related N-acetyltransferase [Clostridiales bacterium]